MRRSGKSENVSHAIHLNGHVAGTRPRAARDSLNHVQQVPVPSPFPPPSLFIHDVRIRRPPLPVITVERKCQVFQRRWDVVAGRGLEGGRGDDPREVVGYAPIEGGANGSAVRRKTRSALVGFLSPIVIILVFSCSFFYYVVSCDGFFCFPFPADAEFFL